MGWFDWFWSGVTYIAETIVTVADAVVKFVVDVVVAFVEAVVEIVKIIACFYSGCVKLTRK